MAVDRLEAVGDPGLRAALLFVRAEARPITADGLADGSSRPGSSKRASSGAPSGAARAPAGPPRRIARRPT